jgi:hypothetical protein
MDSSESADDLVQYNYVTQEDLDIGKYRWNKLATQTFYKLLFCCRWNTI